VHPHRAVEHEVETLEYRIIRGDRQVDRNNAVPGEANVHSEHSL
jgi:hypothetical protein